MIEHLHFPKKYFQEIKRILKPEGKFIFVIPNFNNIKSKYAFGEDVPRHLYFFSEETIKNYAKLTGYSIEKIDFTNKFFPFSSKFFFAVRFLHLLKTPQREIFRKPYNLKTLLFTRPNNSFLLYFIEKIGIILGFLSIWSWLTKITKRTETMVVILRKPK